MKQRISILFITFIILLSLLTISGECVLLQILPISLSSYIISSLVVIFLSHLLLEYSYNFEWIFIYSLLLVIFSTITYIVSVTYHTINFSVNLPISNQINWLILLHFICPNIYAILRNIFDTHDKLIQFKSYFIASTVLFFIYYIGTFVHLAFLHPLNYDLETLKAANYVPFYTIAAYIESYIYGECEFHKIIMHLILPITLYIPIGFYLTLALRRSRLHRLLTIFLLVFFSAATEYIQTEFIKSLPNIDDVIYSLIGGLIGYGMYHFLNHWYIRVTSYNFLEAHTVYHHSRY